MQHRHLLAVFAAASLIPSLAFAQETCEQRFQNRAAGTVIGGVAGALLGGSVTNTRDKTTGAILGGIAGAVVGNQLSKGPADCQHAYGWYDNDGRWRAGAADPSVATGYYDRDGQWVYGRPVDYRPPPPPPQPVARPYRDDRYDDDDEFRGQPGYPEFREQEQHIRFLIQDGVRDDLIERDDARDLMDQLRDIRREEAREYQVHGPRLPRDDFERIRERLTRLDRLVDQIREEP